jgi:hypothetical membrane protein
VNRRTRLAGVGSSLALAAGVLVAVALDPTVGALPVRARLSDLGRPGAPGALVFGLGLCLAGALGLGFARGCWRAANDPLDRAVAAVSGAAFLGLGVAGAVPEPGIAHVPALSTAYLAGVSALLLDGVRRRHGPGDHVDSPGSRAGTVFVGTVGIVAALWALRALVATTFVLSGATSALLLAELGTLSAFGGWVVFRARAGASAESAASGVTAAER